MRVNPNAISIYHFRTIMFKRRVNRKKGKEQGKDEYRTLCFFKQLDNVLPRVNGNKTVPPSNIDTRVLIMVMCQQAGPRATAVKPVCALHFSLVLSLCKQKKERKRNKRNDVQ